MIDSKAKFWTFIAAFWIIGAGYLAVCRVVIERVIKRR